MHCQKVLLVKIKISESNIYLLQNKVIYIRTNQMKSSQFLCYCCLYVIKTFVKTMKLVIFFSVR